MNELHPSTTGGQPAMSVTPIGQSTPFRRVSGSVRQHCKGKHLKDVFTGVCIDRAMQLLRDGKSEAYAIGEAKQMAERIARREEARQTPHKYRPTAPLIA